MLIYTLTIVLMTSLGLICCKIFYEIGKSKERSDQLRFLNEISREEEQIVNMRSRIYESISTELCELAEEISNIGNQTPDQFREILLCNLRAKLLSQRLDFLARTNTKNKNALAIKKIVHQTYKNYTQKYQSKIVENN